MFGLEPSLPAKKALNIFKENNYSKIVELGAGLGRDSIYFGKNSINVTALDYSENGIKVINEKIKKENLTSSISTLFLGKNSCKGGSNNLTVTGRPFIILNISMKSFF